MMLLLFTNRLFPLIMHATHVSNGVQTMEKSSAEAVKISLIIVLDFYTVHSYQWLTDYLNNMVALERGMRNMMVLQ